MSKKVVASQPSPPGMVWVPGGKSLIGSDRHYPEERPAHEVEVAGFWMDITPVTNAQFANFVEETGHKTGAEFPPPYPDLPSEKLKPGSAVFVPPSEHTDLSQPTWWKFVPGANWQHPNGPESDIAGLDHHPVVHVDFRDALDYAAWAGKQLPTEAQWEHAARGGLWAKDYCWGDEQTPNGIRMANYWAGEFPWQNEKPHPPAPSEPGTFPPNPYRLYDMCGSVWEWTMSEWQPNHLDSPDHRDHDQSTHSPNPHSPCCPPSDLATDEPATEKLATEPATSDPLPTAPATTQVIKGGSFLCSENYCSRYRPAARFPQATDTATNHLSFRCILTLS